MPSLAEYYARVWTSTVLQLQKATAEIGLASLLKRNETVGAAGRAREQDRSPFVFSEKRTTMQNEQEQEQHIKERAYSIWQRQGCPDGQDKEHWKQAKAELERETQQGGASIPGPYENIR